MKNKLSDRTEMVVVIIMIVAAFLLAGLFADAMARLRFSAAESPGVSLERDR